MRRMGVDPKNGWAARYEVLPGKEKVVDELKSSRSLLMPYISLPIWIEEERRLRGTLKRSLVVMTLVINALCSTKLQSGRFRIFL